MFILIKYFSFVCVFLVLLMPISAEAPEQSIIDIEPTARTYKRCEEVLELLHEANNLLCKIKGIDKDLEKCIELEMWSLISNYNYGRRFTSRMKWKSSLPYLIYEGSFSCLKTYRYI